MIEIPRNLAWALVHILNEGDFTSGICMCGDHCDNHGHGISDHAPCDALMMAAAEALEDLKKCLNQE